MCIQILGQLIVSQMFSPQHHHTTHETGQAVKKKHFYIYRLILTNRADGTICTKALTAKKDQGPEGRTMLMVSLIGSFPSQHFPLSFFICAA